MNRNYFKAVAILAGTILGAGIFAVPYAIQKAGVLSILIYFPVLFGIQLILHLIYAEIVLATPEKHRMVGYVGFYFNGFFKKIAFLITLLGKHGTLVAYIILGGIFLHQLLKPWLGGTIFIYTIFLFIFETLIVLFGLKIIAKVEAILTILLIIAIGVLSWKSLGYWNVSNYQLLNFKNLLLPYGVIFFAIGGQAAIPEMCRLLKKEKHKIQKAIVWGTLLPVGLIAFFAFLMVGVLGQNISPDVLTGLSDHLDILVLNTSLVFGLLAIMTSYIVISQSLREVYWWDQGLNKNLSWLLAGGVPLIIYLVGVRNLMGVIGITGAITGGLYGIILIAIYFKMRKKKERRMFLQNGLSKCLAIILSLSFILGTFLEIINAFK